MSSLISNAASHLGYSLNVPTRTIGSPNGALNLKPQPEHAMIETYPPLPPVNQRRSHPIHWRGSHKIIPPIILCHPILQVTICMTILKSAMAFVRRYKPDLPSTLTANRDQTQRGTSAIMKLLSLLCTKM